MPHDIGFVVKRDRAGNAIIVDSVDQNGCVVTREMDDEVEPGGAEVDDTDVLREVRSEVLENFPEIGKSQLRGALSDRPIVSVPGAAVYRGKALIFGLTNP